MKKILGIAALSMGVMLTSCSDFLDQKSDSALDQENVFNSSYFTGLEINKIYKTPQEYGGKSITVCGWVKTIRDSKSIGFMEINDGSSFKGIQVVFEEAKIENFKDIAKQNVGAAVSGVASAM